MKKHLLSLTFLILGLTLYGQPYFNRNIIIKSSSLQSQPGDIYTTDVDGDGDLDLIAALDHVIAWYENLDGLGTMGPKKFITLDLMDTKEIFTTDLDNDGDNDIIACTRGNSDNVIVWFENLDGLGTFSEIQSIGETWKPRDLTAVDIDYDGDKDVLYVEKFSLVWQENLDGNGEFGDKQIITSLSAGTGLSINDMNNDGFLDLIATDQNTGQNLGKIFWMENINGTGTFGQENIISEELVNPYILTSADVDMDGDIDIVTTLVQNKFRLISNEGNGNFGIPQNIGASSAAGYIQDMELVDINGDNHLDILFGGPNGIMAWKENDGAGNFGIQNIFATGNGIFLHSADIDSDSDMDVIGVYTGRVTSYRNIDGNGHFELIQELNPSAYFAGYVIAGDLNNDGHNDVVSASGDGKLAVYRNIGGTGIFEVQKIISIFRTGMISPYLADLDGDNDLDLMSIGYSNTGTESLFWHENLSTGEIDYGERNTIYSSSFLVEAIAQDLDNDGDKDVVCLSNQDNPGVRWFENTNGLGNFVLRQNLLTSNGVSLTSLNITDIDLDGDNDVIVCEGGETIIFENVDANLDIWNQILLEFPFYNANQAMIIVDLDLDGDRDIVIGNSDGVGWFKNLNGLLNFDDYENLLESIVAHDIEINDLDGDGDLDIVAADRTSNSVAWYENSGSSVEFFQEHIIVNDEYSARDIFVSDINGDNKLDILTTSHAKGRVSWFENSPFLPIEEETQNEFIIAPNPTKGILNVNHHSPIESVSIINQLGQQVLWFSSEEIIDVSNLENGLYFLKVIDLEGNVQVKRIIKE
ncbi:MAG: T9SS type A sorting domain-containing protein [Flavobacteriaceae bacterium]|nr:T9SS type A sorting domain-containing protein [Flavobacteriaceae bacterium]